MARLNRELLKNKQQLPPDMIIGNTSEFPEKVLQFGEGVFLRGFADWMFNRMNQNGLFNGRVVIIQPRDHSTVDVLNEQDGLYTLFLRGIRNGTIVEAKELITAVSRGISPYRDFDGYMKCAENPDLRIIISNTTEAGIVYNPEDRLEDTPPASFPGKLTVFLYKRFKAFNGDTSKGFIIIPCELIDRNGDSLRRIVFQLADQWNLGSEFISWLDKSNHFLNTLVDRIVTGYPKDEINTLTDYLGFQDNMLDTAEVYHLFVIEGDNRFAEELPFSKAGLNVIWTNDMTPYRTRKVRILNGAHTMTALAAYLCGINTVKECMDNEITSAYMRKGLFEEIIPTLDMSESELTEFASAVLERFSNPFIRHYLLSISLNSVSKFKTRLLPSILEYINRKGKLPEVLIFSLAALIAFYRGTEISDGALIGNRSGCEYKINDDMVVLETFQGLWNRFDGSKEGTAELVRHMLSRTDFWGTDLTNIKDFSDSVADYLYDIIESGPGPAMRKLI